MWTSTQTKNSRPALIQGSLPRFRPLPERAGQSGRRGFTLLEVLVALAILSVVLIALHQAFSANIYLTGFNRSLWRAIVHSHNELQQVERLPAPSIAVSEGDFEEEHPMFGYHWKREVVDDSPIPGVRLRKIKLEISWVEGTSTRSYRSETYVVPK